ncbi:MULTISPECIES: SMI1/KNR4 family protein [Photorhabdus]|uniref:SMI1/KNR4 family protein n=1 Tax=Photorhabdus bodei TaxID=2029681 RepID=A0A329WUR4_9GAMM|nr:MULTISPECIES: SMI1/KNR4 family protein [Photorhabdus]MCC8457800.1 SMI1/KNR4 family protein [Photorhabdus aegyptia]MDB6370381.1 SMI1/KNR4 family protein [Photorhabdus bodei]RAX06963.1 SMI1/KNR4 family protein [Photorhabdus bodei]
MSNIKFFSDHNLRFEQSLHGLSESEINAVIPNAFNGKDFFMKFYIANNGGYFNGGAYLYRDVFYTVLAGDYNLMEIEGFNFISRKFYDDSQYLLSINEVWELRKGYSRNIKEFAKSHFPFAGDAGDNDYWIDMNSGYIKYIRWESDDNPDNAIIVAPTFYDFCMNLQAERRKNKE